MTGREIELKLGVSPEDMARLRLAPPLMPPSERRMVSTYFDTPEFSLAAAGISVRLRRTGDRLIQTVKAAGRGGGALFDRAEWEAPVVGPDPDPGHLRATGLMPFAEAGVIERLEPVFATDIRRVVCRLGGAEVGWEIEAALDQGEVVAGPRSEPICEVELELVQGGPEHLFALARQMLETVPARPLAVTKSERGLRLATGTAGRPVKARPPVLTPAMSVAESFQTVARSCLDHLLVNERCLLATGDGEAIHQMRVALRRLRSAIKVFRPVIESERLAVIREDLRWLLDQLGPARDSEVFLAEIVAPVVARHPDDESLAALRDHWRTDRTTRLATAVAAVSERRFAALVLEITAWVEVGDWLGRPGAALPRRLEAPIIPFARRRLGKATRRLLRHGGDDLLRLSPEALHEVRILGKQVRYTGEFFAALVPRKQMKLFLAELSELQDILGQLNDITMAGTKLGGGSGSADDLVAGWHRGRRPQLLADAERAWTRLRARDLSWIEE